MNKEKENEHSRGNPIKNVPNWYILFPIRNLIKILSFLITEYKYKIMVLHTVGVGVYICEYNFLTSIQNIAT